MEDDESQRLLLSIGGYVEYDARCLPRKKYLTKDSEPQARSVLASILRNQEPLDRDLLNMLAALFDPTPDAHPVIARSSSRTGRKDSAGMTLRTPQ